MKIFPWIVCGCVSVSMAASVFGEDKQKTYPHYWMSVATSNQSMPGMPAEMSGIASMFGGKKMFGPNRELTLQLESPRMPNDAPKADHKIPPEQKMGVSLPLVTPVVEKSGRVSPEWGDLPEKYEKPKARMLIYWGCGETIGKGQPKTIDTATMNPVDFGRAFAGRTPTRQTPPSPRQGWTYGEWPNKDDRTEIPPDSSLVGSHLVKGNYIPDIPFALDKKRDFMAPVEFYPLQKNPAGALKMECKTIPTAIGYFATAIGHNQETGESIFWSASEVPETGFALQDYLTPGDVARFIKEKVILDPSRTTCTIPPIFKEGQAGMLQFIAYGEELNLVHPPKPKDPKTRWDIDWSTKVRLKSTAMLPLMVDESRNSGQKATSTNKPRKNSETKEENLDDARSNTNESGTGSDSPSKEIGKGLRKLFGF
jgi:hypothetical protein